MHALNHEAGSPRMVPLTRYKRKWQLTIYILLDLGRKAQDCRLKTINCEPILLGKLKSTFLFCCHGDASVPFIHNIHGMNYFF